MKTEEVKSTKIEFEGSESDHFKSAIKKVATETTRAGFQRDFNPDEVKVIRDLNDKLNPA